MKKLSSISPLTRETITRIDDLACFLEEYQAQNPEDDCLDIICNICKKNGWVYTDDSEINYDDTDFCTDGELLLSLTSEDWTAFENNGQDIEHNGHNVTVREDAENYYVNFNTGLGDGIYPKTDWTLDKAINDQEKICKENK